MAQHTKNNHYIPKVLIRQFTNQAGERFYCENGCLSKKDAKKIFSASEIYDDRLEKEFNLNECKLRDVLDEIEEKLKIKPSVLSTEISIPEWSILIYNTKENSASVNVLNEFFLRMNVKFFAANTNLNKEEMTKARQMSIEGNLTNCNNLVFIRYNFDFCPFVLPANIPVILPVDMSLVFATPLSKDTVMLHYCNEKILEKFVQKYRYKHQLNLAMIHANTPSGRMLCNFVCSDKEYAQRLLGIK